LPEPPWFSSLQTDLFYQSKSHRPAAIAHRRLAFVARFLSVLRHLRLAEGLFHNDPAKDFSHRAGRFLALGVGGSGVYAALGVL
jgi:hypothetical protein